MLHNESLNVNHATHQLTVDDFTIPESSPEAIEGVNSNVPNNVSVVFQHLFTLNCNAQIHI